MLRKERNVKRQLVVLMSAKEGHRQNNDGHLRDIYDIFLEDLIQQNKDIPFLIIEDKFNLKNQSDSGLIALSGEKFHPIRQTAPNIYSNKSSQNSLVVQGLLAFLKKIFKDKKDYSKSTETANVRSEKFEGKGDKISYEKQLIYNFPEMTDGEARLKLKDFIIHLFADEVDHVNVDWDHISSSENFKQSCVWFAMNSERCNDNDKVIKKVNGFDSISLNFILRNTKSVTDFVNAMHRGICPNIEDTFDLKIGHCVDGLVPEIVFLEEYLNGNDTMQPPEYIHASSNYSKISLSTYNVYKKLPNTIKLIICKMFGLPGSITFSDMIEEMSQVCVISLEIINNFLISCFEIMDEDANFMKKITFETPQSSIGREYNNVVYVGTSYMFLINDDTNDIILSNLINVSSRPKNYLCLIDVGHEETEKIHKTECKLLFENQDTIHQLNYEQFVATQTKNCSYFRSVVFPRMIEKWGLSFIGGSANEAKHYLENNSSNENIKNVPMINQADLNEVLDGFTQFKHFGERPTQKLVTFLPELLISSTGIGNVNYEFIKIKFDIRYVDNLHV